MPKIILTCISGLIALASVGCASRSAAVRIEQPQLAGRQREMSLRSEWADFVGGDDQPRRVLMAFPLPGAIAGNRHFLLYLRLPGTTTMTRVGPRRDGQIVGGFFIQTRGKSAGITRIVDGTITAEDVAFGGDKWCKGFFDLTTDDGTHLDGSYRAKRARFRIRDFEEESHRADVDALLTESAATQPAPSTNRAK